VGPLTFTAPLGLLGLLAVPAVLALHLFRRRRRERRAAALFLFAPEARSTLAGRRWRPPVVTASLILELLAALLLGLAQGGLSLRGAPPHLVLVLDASPSMGARGAGGQSAIERARAEALEAARALGRDALVTLVVPGEPPAVALGPRAPAALLGPALEAVRPEIAGGDPAAAGALARGIAGDGGRVLLLTDATPAADAAAGVEVRAVGEALPNAGVAAAFRRPGGAGARSERVLVEVAGFSGGPLERTVRLVAVDGAEERELGRRPARLQAGEPVPLEWTVPATTLPLAVRLDPPDALVADDEVLLLPEPPGEVRAADRLPADPGIGPAPEGEGATLSGVVRFGGKLSRDLRLARALAAVPGVRVVGADAEADLFFAAAPAATLPPWAVEVVVRAPAGAARAFTGPFLVDAAHPLLADVSLAGVYWVAAGDGLAGRPLVEAGGRALVAEEEAADGAGPVRVVLDLDPARSTLASSPDWPVLVANLVERARARRPGPGPANVRLGDRIEFRRGTAAGADLVLVEPDGSRREPLAGAAASWSARRLGAHRLEASGKEVARFAVHLGDPRESDLRGRGSGVTAAATTAGEARPEGARPLRPWLALLVLAALCGDWYALAKRSS